MRIAITATATSKARSQFPFLSAIFVIAQMAMIGPCVMTCSPMVSTICNWVISFVVRVKRLGMENCLISASEKSRT